jgi:hypothetical protein
MNWEKKNIVLLLFYMRQLGVEASIFYDEDFFKKLLGAFFDGSRFCIPNNIIEN